MTLLDLCDRPDVSSDSLRDRVARHFLAHPNTWISMQELARIGGTGGWRTRVDECRRELRMDITNRTRRVRLEDGSRLTESHYRYQV